MAKQKFEPELKPEDDPYHGHGGSYIRNPDNGKRTLIERTQEADEQPIEELNNGSD